MNNLINQILKTTAYRLFKTSWLKEEYKKKLNNTLLYFNKIDLSKEQRNIENDLLDLI